MPSLDQLKQTFFEECDEALQQIEAGLTEIRDGQSSDDTVNAVFRAVHSVKGGAGIFGFEALVEFAHVFETVLDGVRRGSVTATPETIDVMLTASDVLSDLVQMSRAGDDIPAGFGGECRTALEHIIEQDSKGGEGDDDDSPAPADFDDLDFTPVPIDFGDAPTDTAGEFHSYAITFRPKPDMLKKGSEPLHILRNLRQLGALDLTAQIDRLPVLRDIETDRPYIWWTGTLQTAVARSQLDEVFDFVADDCDLEIVDTAPAPMAVGEPEPVSVSPAAMPGEKTIPVESAPALRIEKPPVTNETSEAAPASRTPSAKHAATTTRIELERIDRVVNMVGELVIAQAMLGQIVQDLPEGTAGRLSQVLEEVIHHTRELKDSVMSMRAQPVGSVFQRMPRLVRELSAKTGKKVRRRDYRGRSVDHRTPGRSAHPYHP
jgi:two-component system chemotaxis sensor kinase CheA